MACIACGHDVSKALYFGILRCAACGFAWADVRLDDAQWRELYGDAYFFGEEYLDYVKEEPALRRNFQRDLEFMSGSLQSGKLLEIGCAYGFFLDEARKKYDVVGVDISESGCRYARERFGVDARHGDLPGMDLPAGSFDAVVMWDVLEHLPRPDLFLRTASRVLKPGGQLFLCTLDMASFLARIQGRHWRQIHPPTHVSYFSSGSLKTMLERAGFRLARAEYFGEYRSWDNTFFSLFALKGRRWVYDFLKALGACRGEYYLNTFDHVYCAAIKE